MDIGSLLIWGLVAVVGLVILAVAGLFVALLLAARFETQHLRRMVRLGDEARLDSRAAYRIVEFAERFGFEFIGVYRDRESDVMSTHLELHLSPDQRTLLMIPSKTRTLGYRLLTSLEDGRVLMTGEILSSSDLTGQRVVVFLPECPFPGVFACHLDRVSAAMVGVVPYRPESIVDHLFEMDMAAGKRSVDMGLAEWRDHTQESWRYNWGGAWRVAVKGIFQQQGLSSSRDLSERYRDVGPTWAG
ncbi:MAG: hypothetical protein AAF916_01935 [Planctomycetota bacterium]